MLGKCYTTELHLQPSFRSFSNVEMELWLSGRFLPNIFRAQGSMPRNKTLKSITYKTQICVALDLTQSPMTQSFGHICEGVSGLIKVGKTHSKYSISWTCVTNLMKRDRAERQFTSLCCLLL